MVTKVEFSAAWEFKMIDNFDNISQYSDLLLQIFSDDILWSGI